MNVNNCCHPITLVKWDAIQRLVPCMVTNLHYVVLVVCFFTITLNMEISTSLDSVIIHPNVVLLKLQIPPTLREICWSCSVLLCKQISYRLKIIDHYRPPDISTITEIMRGNPFRGLVSLSTMHLVYLKRSESCVQICIVNSLACCNACYSCYIPCLFA